jgi:hypothetical protein
LTDFIIKLSYTLQEGGPELGKTKNALVRDRVLGNRLRYFDIRHEFQDAWHIFVGKRRLGESKKSDYRRDDCKHRRIGISTSALQGIYSPS